MLYYAKIHEHYYTSISRNTETGLNIPLIPFYTNANFILLKHNNITYVLRLSDMKLYQSTSRINDIKELSKLDNYDFHIFPNNEIIISDNVDRYASLSNTKTVGNVILYSDYIINIETYFKKEMDYIKNELSKYQKSLIKLEIQRFKSIYPQIQKCIDNIGYDNGAFHRDQEPQQLYQKVWANITETDLTTIEQSLAKLNDEELDLICAGEHSEIDDFLNTLYNGKAISDLLCKIFDNI